MKTFFTYLLTLAFFILIAVLLMSMGAVEWQAVLGASVVVILTDISAKLERPLISLNVEERQQITSDK